MLGEALRLLNRALKEISEYHCEDYYLVKDIEDFFERFKQNEEAADEDFMRILEANRKLG